MDLTPILIIFATFSGVWGLFLLIQSAVRYFNSQIRIANLETQIEQENRHLEFIQSLLEGQQADRLLFENICHS